MIVSFKNQATEDIFNGKNPKVTCSTLPQSLWKVAGSSVSVSTISIGFASNGVIQAPMTLKLPIIIHKGLVIMRIPTDREPTHPGEMLRAEFLQPMGISQRELAEAIHVPYQRVNELVNQKRGVTPSTALRLAKFFNVSADYWLNLQSRWDLYWAQQSEKDDIDSIADFSQVKKLA